MSHCCCVGCLCASAHDLSKKKLLTALPTGIINSEIRMPSQYCSVFVDKCGVRANYLATSKIYHDSHLLQLLCFLILAGLMQIVRSKKPWSSLTRIAHAARRVGMSFRISSHGKWICLKFTSLTFCLCKQVGMVYRDAAGSRA